MTVGRLHHAAILRVPDQPLDRIVVHVVVPLTDRDEVVSERMRVQRLVDPCLLLQIVQHVSEAIVPDWTLGIRLSVVRFARNQETLLKVVA